MNAKSAMVFCAVLLAVCMTAVADEPEFSMDEWRACHGRATEQADKEFACEFFIERQGWSVDLGVPYFESAASQTVFKKYDETGRLVKTGEESDFPEIGRYEARIKALTEIERREYAKSIGISYEDAIVLSTNRVGLLRGRRLLRNKDSNSRLLEPLMPFDEALENAKAGNAAGFYALALHYAKGEEVPYDSRKAALFLQKAESLDYPNAVFVTALAMEANASSSVKDASGGRLLSRRGGFAVSTEYIGMSYTCFKISGLSLENDADIATIRSRYERAIALGVDAATSEVDRFEKKVADIAEKVLSRQSEEASRKTRNKAASALIAEGLELQEEVKREAERRQREIEREEQRVQLLQIQEELRRAKEARDTNLR